MVDKARIEALVYETIDDVNEALEPSHRLEKSLSTPLLGPGSTLDSLGLVSLLVGLEQRLDQTFHRALNLAEELANPQGPFQDVSTLVAHIASRLS